MFGDVEKFGFIDSILETVGSQKDYRFVYGPFFLTLCLVLSKISFSSVTLFLYEFKILNFIIYLLTVYLFYKLTKKKKLTIIFAFNPLILLETLVNVHNDILLLFFCLLGIFFIKKSEKIIKSRIMSELEFIIGLIFFTLSASIKYVTFIILPFFIIYKIRNKRLISKFFYIMIYLIVFLVIYGLICIPYLNNIRDFFGGIISQSGKLKDSIYMLIAFFSNNNRNIVSIFYSIGFFILGYIFIVKILMQLFRQNDYISMMENCYIVLLSLIFLGLTNLTSWYLIWLFIPVFWTRGNYLKSLILIRFCI